MIHITYCEVSSSGQRIASCTMLLTHQEEAHCLRGGHQYVKFITQQLLELFIQQLPLQMR